MRRYATPVLAGFILCLAVLALSGCAAVLERSKDTTDTVLDRMLAPALCPEARAERGMALADVLLARVPEQYHTALIQAATANAAAHLADMPTAIQATRLAYGLAIAQAVVPESTRATAGWGRLGPLQQFQRALSIIIAGSYATTEVAVRTVASNSKCLEGAK